MSEELEKEVQEVETTTANAATNSVGFFDKVQHFFEEKQQLVTYGGAGLLVVIGALVFVFMKWLPDRNLKAQKEMFHAELAFAKDSFNVALNGNGANKGFLEIGNKYSFTKAANLSNYYAGICYLNLKQYDNAVKYLDKFSTSDPILGAVKLNAIGDAYSELGKMDDATSYYKKAASFSKNEVYTPYFLFKAALAYEKQKKYSDAKALLEEISTNYPNSDEGREAEKYLARVNAAI
ncbi:MAG: tetratricopeptide repeat protein [Chitinophagales bacterium]|nr:tetratricopeptide repeat protein [Chitinophagales bacterium]